MELVDPLKQIKVYYYYYYYISILFVFLLLLVVVMASIRLVEVILPRTAPPLRGSGAGAGSRETSPLMLTKNDNSVCLCKIFLLVEGMGLPRPS